MLAGTGIVLDAPEVRLVWLPERGDELSDGRLQEIEMTKVSIGASGFTYYIGFVNFYGANNLNEQKRTYDHY